MSAYEGSALQESMERQAREKKNAPPPPTPPVAATPAEKEDRGIGPEKLSVRIFREVFTNAVEPSKLHAVLEDYLKRVISHPQSKKSDKTYARKIFTDLSARVGTPGLPEWAASPPEISTEELSEILDGAVITTAAEVEKILSTPIAGTAPSPAVMVSFSDPAPVVAREIPKAPPPVDIDPLDAILEQAKVEERATQLFERAMNPLLEDFIACKNEYPFVRTFSWKPEEKFVALGTVMGVITKGKHAGKKINAMCVVDGYRRFRDVPEGVALHRNGRQVSLSKDDPETGLRKYLFVVHHKPGMKIRYWMRIDEKDVENGARYLILDDSHQGFKLVTRETF